LLDERVPPSPPLEREEALAELTRRYFCSHGPAQVQDFSWWSGLTMADARAGLALADAALAHDIVGGKTYWFSSSMPASPGPPRTAYLLPLYDEYLIAYKDRSAALGPFSWERMAGRDSLVAPLVVGGRVAGGWRSTLEKNRVVVRFVPQAPDKTYVSAIGKAARAYADFLGIDVALA
jgi:hypothetical protein